MMLLKEQKRSLRTITQEVVSEKLGMNDQNKLNSNFTIFKAMVMRNLVLVYVGGQDGNHLDGQWTKD